MGADGDAASRERYRGSRATGSDGPSSGAEDRQARTASPALSKIVAYTQLLDEQPIPEVQVIPDFGPTAIAWPIDKDGKFTGSGAYQVGVGGEVVLVRCFYQFSVWLPLDRVRIVQHAERQSHARRDGGIPQRALHTMTSETNNISIFSSDADGAAAVEFALIMPLLVLLILGLIDLTEGVNARRKLVVAGSTVSDLVARVKEVDAGYARSVMAAGTAIMAPLDTSRLKIVVSSVLTDQTGRSTVAWSLGQNAGPRPQGSDFPLPSAMKPVAGLRGAAVIAEISFSYKPILTTDFLQSLDMAQTFVAQPRIAATGVHLHGERLLNGKKVKHWRVTSTFTNGTPDFEAVGFDADLTALLFAGWICLRRRHCLSVTVPHIDTHGTGAEWACSSRPFAPILELCYLDSTSGSSRWFPEDPTHCTIKPL